MEVSWKQFGRFFHHFQIFGLFLASFLTANELFALVVNISLMHLGSKNLSKNIIVLGKKMETLFYARFLTAIRTCPILKVVVIGFMVICLNIFYCLVRYNCQ